MAQTLKRELRSELKDSDLFSKSWTWLPLLVRLTDNEKDDIHRAQWVNVLDTGVKACV